MRGRRHKLQVSTFPFLAVLLCAMGSLILVLLVMDRKAHRAAQARAQREAVRLAEERAQGQAAQQAERDRLQQQARKDWDQKRDALHDKLTSEQVEMQLQMRKVREQLQDIAARLHYEQDTSTDLRRKAQGERDRLQAEEQLLRTLRSRSEQSANQSKESSQALRRMTLDLLQMEQALKDLKTSRQREQKSFSVVPYHGRRGENRRPIYVECTSDAVIFHPERKVIPRNALVPGADDPTTSLRAEVARRVANQRAKLAPQPGDADQNPYLLLLVRPSGVNTYNYLYHSALKDLRVNDKDVQVDFGYEFIDDDWVLDFPADDEQPSSQPWMIATKSSATPAVAPALPAVASTSPRTSDHPIALAPMGDQSGGSGGIRGFRASENGGPGNWVRGPQARGAPPGTRAAMPGSGSTGGAWPSQGGGGGTGSSTSVSGSSGVGGGGGIGTAGAGGTGSNRLGFASGASTQSSGATAPFSPSDAYAPGGGGGGSNSLFSPPSGGGGVGGEGSGGSFGVVRNRGSGRGHPAALAPSYQDGGSGGDDSGDGGPPPNGLVGSGVFSLGKSGAAQGYGSTMQGSPGAGGPGVPGAGGPGVPGAGGPGVPGVAGSGSPGGMNIASPGVVGSGSPGIVGSGPAGAGVSGAPGVGGLGTSGLGGPGAPGIGPSGIPGVAGVGVGSPGVGVSGSPGAGVAGVGVGSPGVGVSGSPGVSGTGSPGGGSDLPGLGPPRALSSPPRDGYAGGTGQSGSAGTGSGGSGAPGNGMVGGGSTGSAVPGSATGTGTSPNGRYVIAQANNGGLGSTTGSNDGGGATGTGSSATAGAPGSGGSSPGTPSNNGSSSSMQGSGGSYSGTQSNNGSNPPMQGQGSSSPGTQPVMDGSSGSQPVMGGSPGTQATGGGSMPANGGRSSDVVIYVDPLTGKPTAPPRPTSPPDGAAEQQSQETDGQPRPPRVRVVTAGSGGGGGGSSDPQAERMNRFAPTPSLAPERHKPVTPHPIWVHGGRDWTIYVECRADALVLYPSQLAFPLTQITSSPANNPLSQEIQKMIERRQALRRQGEPAYRPQVCLLVRPEFARTFFTVSPALEALPVPKSRRNLDADDDVIDIVNGTAPP